MSSFLYYEAHVTVEPVFDERLEQFSELCKKYQFRAADLLMKKRKNDTPARSSFDSFCTGRSNIQSELFDRMIGLLDDLKNSDFKVYRYKIEAALFDSKIDDSAFKLNDDISVDQAVS
jgi:hypothetical protein